MTDKIEIRKLNELHRIHKAIENKNSSSNTGEGSTNNNQNTNNIDVSTPDGIKKLFEIILTNSSEQSIYNLDYENSTPDNDIFLSDEEILESVKQNQIISIDEINTDTPLNTIFTFNTIEIQDINRISGGISFDTENSSDLAITGVFLFTINNISYSLLKGVVEGAPAA